METNIFWTKHHKYFPLNYEFVNTQILNKKNIFQSKIMPLKNECILCK